MINKRIELFLLLTVQAPACRQYSVCWYGLFDHLFQESFLEMIEIGLKVKKYVLSKNYGAEK